MFSKKKYIIWFTCNIWLFSCIVKSRIAIFTWFVSAVHFLQLSFLRQGSFYDIFFTTVPYANTSSLPSGVRLFGAGTGWEKRSNKRKDNIPGSSPNWTLSEPCASPTVQRSCVEKVGCGSWAEERKGHAGGRQLAELPNRARWSSLVASRAAALNNKRTERVCLAAQTVVKKWTMTLK